MTAQKERQYEGGKNVAEKGGLDEDMRDVADSFTAIKPGTISQAALVQDKVVIEGGYVGDPTTPSSQLTGAGNTTWNVDIAAIIGIVNAVEAAIAAAADTAIHSGSKLLDNGQSVFAWLVVSESGGSLAFEAVKGTPATTDSQTIPTDADITTGVGHANWMKLALCLLNRTGDTTVTQSQDNTYREPLVGPLALALTNAMRTDHNAKAAATVLTTKG